MPLLVDQCHDDQQERKRATAEDFDMISSIDGFAQVPMPVASSSMKERVDRWLIDTTVYCAF